MCGITGIYHINSERSVERKKLKQITDVLSHRGPDDEGFYCDKNVGLGHRRLSIIDIADGNQPMFSENGDICLVFNGEIYNYVELRSELEGLGHFFRTTSDTEVIIKAYQEWGFECQNKFNGMWAFAIWDQKRKHLFLSRDRIGEKPLYYTIYDDTLIFASEMKSLFAYGVPKEIRQELIEIYLVLTYIPGPDTFYKNIFNLKPGHFIIANSEGIKEHKYWGLPSIDEDNMLTDSSAIYDEFTHLLEDSVKIRMRSDVPFGAFLSGGLDSSSIVSMMANNSIHPTETFTIGFPEKAFDESHLAGLVAERFQTNHHLGTVKPDSLIDSINRAVNHFDEPFGDSSAIPTYQVSKFASENVKMVLTGDGGDEVLSGYNSYAGIKLSSIINRFPLPLQKAAIGTAKLLSKNFKGNARYTMNRVSNVLETASLPFAERLANKSSYIPLEMVKQLTNPIQDLITIEDYTNDLTAKIPYQNDFYRLMYRDIKYSLPDDYLVKVDRMSMANSLETRTPFLDHRLIEFMVKVDKNVKMQGWEKKSILRKTIGKKLPPELLSAPKRGFGVPLRHWFQKDQNINHLKFDSLKSICNPEVVEKIVSENKQGKSDNGNFIWTMIMLNEFL